MSVRRKNSRVSNHIKMMIAVYTEDAIDLMNSMRKEKRHFDVIDLDPYGTAVPFLESTLQAVADGGLLAVTCTDMAVLCARNPHVCFYKYGGAPLPKPYCHEVFD
jgi:tRNA G26 N,N-dimethylase Trm1